MKAYQAYFDGNRVTASSPREAAREFFQQNPRRRKCNVIEGEVNGSFFTVKYGRSSEGDWPKSWKDVTKKSADDLPV